MFKKVESRVDLIRQEHDILAFWDEQKTFAKLVKQNEDGPIWSFLDGPITANNPMGVHHAWGRTLKDCYERFHAMKGHAQRYQNGFDCQGLWIEVEVEKELGFKSKRDIEEYGLEKFVEKCKERARKYAKVQTEQSIRLGYWMHWDDSYYTMTDENNYTIWTFLKKCHERGLIYKGRDSMPWCARCGTGISQHEMHEGYEEVEDPSVFLRMPIRGRENEYLLVWTTTPWTLAANVACAVGPDMAYSKVKQGDAIYYLASSLVHVMKEKGPFEVLGELPGRDLVDWTYDGPFDDLPACKEAKEAHRVLAWDVVSESEGTGIVHIATGCGREDFELGQEMGLPVVAPIDENGIYFDGFGALTGKSAHEVADQVMDLLRERGFYYKRESYKHSYPHCWRCGQPLLYRNVAEWFIDMSWRDEIMEVAKKIKWMPEWGLDQELNWLENMRDWMISKKRYWGLALPIYECECGWFDVIGSKEELKERAVEGWEKFEGNSPHRPWVDEVKIACGKCSRKVSRIADVGNPWLDAGIVPYSTVKYNTDRDYWQKWIPADLVLECFPGQFRNWFYALLAMSTMMENIPPFKALLGHALVKDEHGKEMHKTAGNAIWFNDAAEKMGVDVMRWIYCRQNPENNLNFGYGPGKLVQRTVFDTWWNTYAFFCNYARLADFDPKAESVPMDQRTDMDRWVLSKLNLLVETANRAFPEYGVPAFVRDAEEFIERLSNWYVRRNRRRFWRERSDEDANTLAAYQTLHTALVTLCKVLAPVVPFVTEAMYRNLVRGHDESAPESVHLCKYPEADRDVIDNDLARDMDVAADVVSTALSVRKTGQIRVRQPLPQIVVASSIEQTRNALKRFESDILDELNVKELSVIEDAGKLVSYTVKPNFKALGPKLGKAMKAVAAELARADGQDLAKKVQSGQSISVTAGGESYELTPDEVEVQAECPDHLLVQEVPGMTVALNTQLTDELIAEGMVRDVLRHIQILRKDQGLELEDRIVLSYSTDHEKLAGAMATWKDYVMAETLAIELHDEIEGDPQTTAKTGDAKISLSLKKA
ncbi:MAG: isoleucine--tRNA ligase [Planctomycetes bacterium]|nr:isoleucine--tRNA ligase [Planctomycetota bacterium]